MEGYIYYQCISRVVFGFIAVLCKAIESMSPTRRPLSHFPVPSI